MCVKPIKIRIQEVARNENPDGRKQGAIAVIFKSGCVELVKNYRPITLLKSIYKIWDAVITNGLEPIMAILTNYTHIADTK